MNYTIVDKWVDMAGKYRVRVQIAEWARTEMAKFDHDPTTEELNLFVQNIFEAQEVINIPSISAKSINLMEAENRYILFCRSIGLSDKASSTDFENLVNYMNANGMQLEAIQVSIKALALINDVTQNNGKWADIEFNEGV